MTDLAIERPTGPGLSRWRHMSPRERAYAVRLVLAYGWLGRVDVTRSAIYDTDNDRVAVEWTPGDPRSACAWATLTPETTVETVLAGIERSFGPAARARAEESINA